MPSRPRALIAALICGSAALAVASILPQAPLDVFDWNLDRRGHGGFSALEMQDGGETGVLLIDSGWYQPVTFRRDASGAIRQISKGKGTRLANPPWIDEKFDTESLVLGDQGTGFFVATEGPATVLHFTDPAADFDPLPADPATDGLPKNRGIEALAMDPDGRLWAIFEHVAGGTMTVRIYETGGWRDGPPIPQRDGFVATGLDFDDTGRLYLLERKFRLPFRFLTRIRRFDPPEDADSLGDSETVVLDSKDGRYDNLEGVSVWRDGSGQLRLTAVSDDNFMFLQNTRFVEIALPD